MFVRDVALDSPGDAVTLAEFMEYSSQAKGNAEKSEEENWCSVPGCCIPFPPEPDSHAKHGWSYRYQKGRKLVWHATNLCKTHYSRLKALGDRNDFAALDRFHTAVREQDQSCLAPDLELLLLNFPGSSEHKRANIFTNAFLAPWSGSSMENVLFAIVNSSGKIFRSSPRSSPRAAQTTYPSGQLRFMLHSVRSSCVECWQVSECCVTWFCSTARRVTIGSLHSTLSTSLSSHWSVSRIAATTYTSGMISLA